MSIRLARVIDQSSNVLPRANTCQLTVTPRRVQYPRVQVKESSVALMRTPPLELLHQLAEIQKQFEAAKHAEAVPHQTLGNSRFGGNRKIWDKDPW